MLTLERVLAPARKMGRGAHGRGCSHRLVSQSVRVLFAINSRISTQIGNVGCVLNLLQQYNTTQVTPRVGLGDRANAYGPSL